MNITIVGTGYVGLVTGTCFAETGHIVTCVDINEKKISDLNDGILPIYEPGLYELVMRNVRDCRLMFRTSLADSIQDSDVVFIAVGTPMDKDGSADLKYVLSVAEEFARNLNKYTVIVTKSTVPVGTAEKVRSIITKVLRERGVDVEFDVVSNPEFLKEGDAIADFMKPERIVIGTDSERSKRIMENLYDPFIRQKFNIIFMDIPSAELTKYAANAMLAMRISFMNQIAALCDATGADVNNVRKGIGTDSRIGTRFLYAGCGYGGSCFPKDVRALINTGKENEVDMSILKEVDNVNNRQKDWFMNKLRALYGVNGLSDKNVAVLGIAFKPGTDDMREAPSIVLINGLLDSGCNVTAVDPVAREEAERYDWSRARTSHNLRFAESVYKAAAGADIICLVTEWQQFKNINWDDIKKVMRGNVILDGRNVWKPEDLRSKGFNYIGVGVH